ncbi:hypothetical protein M3Y98_00893900 [Aphelenchoides besseyi]|nr:hypothetical protein M3Y98_00893900 [Aphelenchoides besseyi]KAI6193022.1 hypothetical protein M3Y96_00974000 [Aphelenchoides besseyi]
MNFLQLIAFLGIWIVQADSLSDKTNCRKLIENQFILDGSCAVDESIQLNVSSFRITINGNGTTGDKLWIKIADYSLHLAVNASELNSLDGYSENRTHYVTAHPDYLPFSMFVSETSLEIRDDEFHQCDNFTFAEPLQRNITIVVKFSVKRNSSLYLQIDSLPKSICLFEFTENTTVIRFCESGEPQAATFHLDLEPSIPVYVWILVPIVCIFCTVVSGVVSSFCFKFFFGRNANESPSPNVIS